MSSPALIYRNAGAHPDVPIINLAFYEIFTRRKSPSGQTWRFLDATFAGVTPAQEPHPRRPDVEPRQSGL
jgi:hypothetical protein